VSSLEIERRDGIPIARAMSDIDAANAALLREELGSCLDGGADALVVDLSETRYVDSAGLDMLLRLSAMLVDRRATLMLVIPTESQLSRLAAIVGLDVAMPVHTTVDEALEAHAAQIASIPAAAVDPEHVLPGEEPGQ
jgi:anti-sigma B factor antagonist